MTTCNKCGKSIYWHWIRGRKSPTVWCFSEKAALPGGRFDWNATWTRPPRSTSFSESEVRFVISLISEYEEVDA